MKDIDKEQYEKLVRVFNKYIDLTNRSKLDNKEIRHLQYLVKTIMPKEKAKYYNLINIYKNENDIFLNNFVYNLYEKLKDNK